MREVDVRNIVRFNTRMGMYVRPSDRASVVSFLHGYEYGTGGECRFTKILGVHLAKKHRVQGRSRQLAGPDRPTCKAAFAGLDRGVSLGQCGGLERRGRFL